MKGVKQEDCKDLSGSSRRMSKEADSQDFLSGRSSAVDHVEEISLESSRKSQDVQVVMSETAGEETRGRGEDAWRLETRRRNGDSGNQSYFARGGRRQRGP